MADKTRRWRAICEVPIEVYTVPGEQASMLSAPHVRTAAEILRRCIEERLTDVHRLTVPQHCLNDSKEFLQRYTIRALIVYCTAAPGHGSTFTHLGGKLTRRVTAFVALSASRMHMPQMKEGNPTMTSPTHKEPLVQEDNLLQLRHFDYIEMYVGNAPQAAHFWRTALGFTPVAYAGLETGVRDRMSYVLEQGAIRLVLTSPLTCDGPISEHVRRHSDSVKDIAFHVQDAVGVFEGVLRAGATPVQEPTVIEDDHGQIIKATIAAYGDTVHSFVQRDGYTGTHAPSFRALQQEFPVEPTGLTGIDHVAVGIPPGELEHWVDFYTKVLSFHELQEEMVSTEHSAMNSKVVEAPGGHIKFPMVEPASTGTKRSQVDEYLTYHNGAGAQHLAFLCDDIIWTIQQLKKRGISFLKTPGAYYDLLPSRISGLDAKVLNALRDLHVLVDKDDWGTLMQIFSKPVQSRPTMFIEFIQRNGARGFGGGNIKALFEAVEREQAMRGNA